MCYSLMKQAQPTGEQHSQTNNFCSQVKFLKIQKIEFPLKFIMFLYLLKIATAMSLRVAKVYTASVLQSNK